jgi:hypothetical protein
MMDHNEAVRQKATEKYMLDELDPDLRDQFEEHLFDCQECALDVRAAAMFVEQTKVVLTEPPAEVRVSAAKAGESKRSSKRGWLAWLRPAFAAPALAMLIVVIGYQNHLLREANEPQIGPWASVNVSTRGSEPQIVKTRPGEGFSLLVNLPPDQSYSAYTLELYNPAGKLQWAHRIPASSPDDGRSIYVSGAGLEQGIYTLATNGVTATGESSKTGSKLIEVQIQK